MSTSTDLPYAPALVHVTGIDDAAAGKIGAGSRRRPRASHVIPRTVVLTADEPVKQLLTPDPHREWVIIIARANTIVLAESKGDGQAAANTGDATAASPNGAAIPPGLQIGPFACTNELWAAGATYPTPVTVLACYTRE